MSRLTPIHFRVPSLIFGPLVAKYLAENGVSGTFWKKLLAQFISYLSFILMGWVSWPLYIFMFLASFSTLWWPNIWLKMGFLEFFIGSIHYIPGIYPWGDIWMRIFMDEVGSDQSRGILSPFMGTACSSRRPKSRSSSPRSRSSSRDHLSRPYAADQHMLGLPDVSPVPQQEDEPEADQSFITRW